MGSSASLDRSPKKNWVENTGELPAYVREIARSVEKTGKSLEQSIAIAISRIKVWAGGGGSVSAKTQAKASKALGEWNALKAKAKGNKAKLSAIIVVQSRADAVSLTALEDLTLRLSVERAENNEAVALSQVLDRAIRL